MTMTREQIERIRDGWAATGWLSTDDAHALFDYALAEQERIDAAVAKERARCAGIAADHARRADSGEYWIACKIVEDIRRTPTPTTEECA